MKVIEAIFYAAALIAALVLLAVFFVWFLVLIVGVLGLGLIAHILGMPIKITQTKPDGRKVVIGYVKWFKFYPR